MIVEQQNSNFDTHGDLDDNMIVEESDELDDDMLFEQNDESDDNMVLRQNGEQLDSDSMMLDVADQAEPVTDSYLDNGDDANVEEAELHDSTHDFASRGPNMKEISTALVLFRHRHRLSKACINDLCDLLRSFGVGNVPSDFRSIEQILHKSEETILQARTYMICSKCGNQGNNLSKCENMCCESSSGFTSSPTTLCTFKILPQITSILERHPIINKPDIVSSNMSDIQDGHMYRQIRSRERIGESGKHLITMLLNSDGIALKKFNRSIWITCMVINELPRAVRFNINNVIVCCISMGGTKPKKSQFQSFLKDWIIELQHLELGFYISPPSLNGNYIKVHAYLIAAALDKPAQALLMNLNDPTGYYSCVRCTIKGKLLDFQYVRKMKMFFLFKHEF
ncbi:unnamed protein product [Rotaria sp. Silwood2]|nr:unnamed protein product [Rotaria sp. Silwood2]